MAQRMAFDFNFKNTMDRCYAYLLKRYLGQYFHYDLSTNQLNLSLRQGSCLLQDLHLDVQALNELAEAQNWPFEFVNGFVEKLSIVVPWTCVLTESCTIEVTNLKVTMQPRQREEDTSLFDNMWGSMTSSIALATECTKQMGGNSPNANQSFEGLEKFAQTIESILNRTKVTFLNSVFQIEYLPTGSHVGIGVVIDVDLISYSDEASADPSKNQATNVSKQEDNKSYFEQSYTARSIRLEGVRMSTLEFSREARSASTFVVSSNSVVFDKQNDYAETSVEKIILGLINKNSPEPPVKTIINKSTEDHDVVVCAKFEGDVNIIVKLKRTEDLEGPKVLIEVNAAPLILFLSPRQIQLLSEFVSGLVTPCTDSNNVSKTPHGGKPLTDEDRTRIQKDLEDQFTNLPLNYQGLTSVQGWGTGTLEGSDPEGTFFPLQNNLNETAASVSGTMYSSFTSAGTSVYTEATSRMGKKMKKMETDSTADISKFNIHLSALALVLLHEDKLMEDVETKLLLPSTVKQMQTIAQEFFEVSKDISLLKSSEMLCIDTILNKACKWNHLRLLVSPLYMEADERTTSAAIAISGYLQLTSFNLSEYIYVENKVEQIPLLTFQDSSITRKTTNLESCKPVKTSIKLNFKQITRTRNNTARNSDTKTDITFNLYKCVIDLDITIIDRLFDYIILQNICTVSNEAYNLHETTILGNNNQSKTNISVICPAMTAKIRFPKPDLRPQSKCTNRWWARQVRADYLLLVLHEMSMSTCFLNCQSIQEYKVQCSNMNVDYFEDANSTPIQIAKAGYEDKHFSSLRSPLPKCKFNIKIASSSYISSNKPKPIYCDIQIKSIASHLEESKPRNGPFNTKTVFYESDTPHSGTQKDDTKELLVPGLKSEISEFIKATTLSAHVQIDIDLPTVTMQLNSKHLYETIYNRITNDLLLWESSALKKRASLSAYDRRYNNLTNENDMENVFTPCRSGMHQDSESENEDDDIYHSAYASRSKICQNFEVATDTDESFLTLNLQISRGLLCMFTPVRDSLGNNVIPGQQGEFLINVENAYFFMVNGYNKDPDLAYFCSEIQKAQLYHCGLFSTPSYTPPLKDIDSIPAKHLLPTIYRSENGMLNTKKDNGERDMITLCIKIKANHETHHVKNVSVAAGFNQVTLRHRMSNAPNSWITQLLDFFNISDYPTPGYHAKENITELFIYFWDSAIDYRPLNLPLRTVITLGTFSISSHLSEEINTSTLRFIAEECGLFLCKTSSKNRAIHVDLRRDYVNVIELGLFDISLKTSDKKSTEHPHIDFRASNNVIEIRTCADSASSLNQLIQYFANNGDLINSDLTSSTGSAYSSPRHLSNQELVNIEPQEFVNLSESQHKQVNDLIQDAIKDVDEKKNSIRKEIHYKENTVADGISSTPKTSKDDDCCWNTTAQTYLFPNETFPTKFYDGNGQIIHLPPTPSEIDNECDYDDFCFIDQEPEFNFLPKSGVPEIKWLTDDSVRIIENHFTVPTEKCDPLKTPKNFPVPTTRYTLREMSIVWHMYGGNDFGNKVMNKKKNVDFSDLSSENKQSSRNKNRVGTCSGNDDKSWWAKGGVNRNQDVRMELHLKKIKILHEIYPETSLKASRQVLIVTDLEFLDRLKDSQINKFLYQYTSQLRPKQSNASMLVIKALHVRTGPKFRTQECDIKISMLPLKFNIDQDALQFIISYFTEFGIDEHEDTSVSTSRNSTPVHQPPIMTVIDNNVEILKEEVKKIEENFLIFSEDNKMDENIVETVEKEESTYSSMSGSDERPIFFRNILFSHEVPIILDYHGKHVDLQTHGPIGFALGVFQLNFSELRLKRISHRRGILGFDKLITFLLGEWGSDIKKNQISKLMVGIGPMHAFMQFLLGIRDLFCLPFEQYKKDGRFFRGLHRGANSFTTSTVMAALELTTRLINLIQILSETAFDMLTSGPSVRINPRTKKTRKRYNQPKDIREGVNNAYSLVKQGIEETADNFRQVASQEHEYKGYSGAVGGVIRQIPPTIIKPIIIASEATNNVLGGVRCQLIPDARKEASDKWRRVDANDSNL